MKDFELSKEKEMKDELGLMKVINSPYNAKKYQEINNEQIFYKLNWRKEYHEMANGELTIYGYIKQNLE